MSAPSATVERAALAPCWFCGANAPAGRCLDVAACFARSVSPPPGHPTGRGACDPEEAPCSGCAAAYSEAWAEPDGDDGADAGEP